MKRILSIFYLFILSGCTLHAEFHPEKNQLKDAVVGVPYYVKIDILGGHVATLTNSQGDRGFVGDIRPDDVGLHLEHCNNDKYDNNCVQIKGIPTKKGMVKVRVSGFFNVAMFQKSSEFDKTYIIRIKDTV
ncbi:hypothetical protein [Raoultella terrigena]|uniref:hypothetical protein n=1 Tax=Raoultella terrigena TaxID=577 RepID=UPI0015BF3D63|nr:hypothetical protein [Raoultella terrigena]NWK87971.1 hypothetical protein [Raoultella terrigena]